MKGTKLFPSIRINTKDGRCEGIAGLRMDSILKGNLLLHGSAEGRESSQQIHRLNPLNQHRQREGLVAALAGWPSHVSLEVSITALPDLAVRPDSHLWISMFIRGQSNICTTRY